MKHLRFTLCLTLFLATVTSVVADTSDTGPFLPTETEIPVIRAQKTGEGDPHFRHAPPPVTSTQPEHPPLHLIPAMPLPRATETSLQTGRFPGMAVRDLRTGATEFFPAKTSTADQATTHPGWPGPSAAPDGPVEPATKSFYDLLEITETSIHPWRMNAKMVVQFRDVNDKIRYTSCSAVMVDAETALTAGHCVYLHRLELEDGSIVDINDYALRFWIYPGWTGDGVTNDNLPDVTTVIEPYGYAEGTSSSTTLDWIFGENLEGDTGVVRVTRAAGMLTGWFGTASGGTCSWIQSQTYHNASYPSEYCGQPGMYNGTTMYYWYGAVDACPGNQFQVLVTGGCENNGWKGMSGSGIYYVQEGTRFVHALASHGSTDVDINFCRLTGTYTGWIYDTFIPMTRGSVFDLQALDVTGPESLIVAGDTLPESTVFITNPTNASAAGTWTFRAYLSADHNITDSDTLLGTYSFYRNFGPMASVRVTMDPSPVLPIDTPSGFYHLGVILDPTTDAEPDNNATMNWDAQRFTSFGTSDMAADSAAAPEGVFTIDDQLQVDFQVRNLGAYASGEYSVQVRASTNTYISASDPLLGSFDYPALGGGSVSQQTVEVSVPPTIAPGTYYIGILVVDPQDDHEENNRAYDSTSVTIRGFDIFADGFESRDVSAWSSSNP